MAVACSTSAFKMPLDEALGRVAELGFGFVDLIAIPSWGHVVPAELADDWQGVSDDVTGMLDRHGLRPVAMNCALPTLYERDADTVAERLRQAEAIARLMERLNVGVASFYPGYRTEDRPWDRILADSAATWRELVAVADEHGVTFAVELHYDTPFQTLQQANGLLEAVPELGVAYDPSHFVMQEIDLRDTGPVLERTAHVHLRDAGPDKMQVPLGEGTVDFEWVVRTLAESGYAGHYSVEYLPDIQGGPERQIRGVKAKLEELLAG